MKSRHRSLLITFIVVITISLMQIHVYAADQQRENGQFNGLTLDVARRYYQPDTIKSFISQVAQNHGQFIQLHLSDAQSFAIENETVGQRLANATQTNGVWRNNTTHQAFYSKAQVADLVTFAKQKHVTLIPEVDTPAHINGMVKTMRANHQTQQVDQLTYNNKSYGREFHLNKASTTFVKRLDTEVAQSFSGQQNMRFHLGGDEFTDQTGVNKPYIAYLNALAKNVRSLGFIPEAWNDGYISQALNQYDKHIQITYWNWTADEKGAPGKERQKAWATMPELIHHGFKVLNYNDYYLYFNLSKKNVKSSNVTYMTSDMKQNWDPTIWDNDNDSSLNTLHNIVGSSVSIWADKDPHSKINDKQVLQASQKFLSQFLQLARQPI
ncbi:family 20 glycosylhydrolase [Furfurilactobacillus milii]|uniref:Family 20 glycosylhydrolase n=1 Tax=Furfurilactobacillus milii TaxID=2888272 RepID=A0A6N9I226_9LACO|nr:family 20 glycosylhydrolase [Furfurilactobacillus milii]MYV17000.1 family 20 glycosylhydrolase [Furfurilactobacillus milii]